MFLFRLLKFRCVFAVLIGFGQLAFFGQNNLFKQGFQVGLIGRTVEAFVKTTGIKTGKFGFRGFNHRHRDFVIGSFLHDHAMQDKAMTVFHNADPQAQFHRDTGFAFADPFGVGLEQGEDLFVMRSLFIMNRATSYLVDLTIGMQTKRVQISEQHFRNFMVIF